MKLKNIETKLTEISGTDVKRVQQSLMACYVGDSKISKPLRNKPVITIFYRVVDERNVHKLLEVLGA